MTAGYDSGFSEHFFTAPDGVSLYARQYGMGNPGLPAVCLPGLTRNSRDFHQLALKLAEDEDTPRRVVALDYRGRGRSGRDPDPSHYNLMIEAGDVIAACAKLGVAHAAFIGTSRGGLTLHLLAGLAPQLLGAVILNDIGPVIETAGLAEIQAYLGRQQRPVNFDDAANILREIHGPRFPGLADQDWRDMADAIYREIDGRIVADFDPAIADQVAALDLTKPAGDLWAQYKHFESVPLMVIRGEFSSLLSPATVERMAEHHPDLVVLEAAGQGHAPLLHLQGIAEEISDFIARRAVA
ncbi:MAG: alpha/beta fold hydrolase [Allorhizobium sp.]